VDPVHQDCFVVFVRADQGHGEGPERAEWPVAVCATYADARRARQRWNAHFADPCVIRFVGPAGGGD